MEEDISAFDFISFLPRSSSSFVKIAPLFEVLLSIYKASRAQSPSPSPEYINVMAVLALHRNKIHQYLAKACEA